MSERDKLNQYLGMICAFRKDGEKKAQISLDVLEAIIALAMKGIDAK